MQKQLFLQKAKSWKEVLFTLFCFRFLSQKSALEVFHMNCIRLVRDHVRVYIWFLSLGILSQKWSSWSTSPTFKYISQENHKFKLTYLYIELDSALIFSHIRLYIFEYMNQMLKQKEFGHQTFDFKKNYTLILSSESNLSFFQIKRLGEHKLTLK